MDDKRIVDLYLKRNEFAIEETRKKYGSLCYDIAYNLLSDRQDAEECVNDTYHAVWSSIPPQNPSSLKAFLGRIIRNVAISRYRKNTAGKRDDGITLMLSELSECLPAGSSTEQDFESRQLTELIGAWLKTLDNEDRFIFVRRYWYGDDLKTIALLIASAAPYLANRMYRLRTSLRDFLEKEGITV